MQMDKIMRKVGQNVNLHSYTWITQFRNCRKCKFFEIIKLGLSEVAEMARDYCLFVLSGIYFLRLSFEQVDILKQNYFI